MAGGGFDGGVKESRRMLSPSGDLPESCARAQSSAEKGSPCPVCGDRKQSAREGSRGKKGKFGFLVYIVLIFFICVTPKHGWVQNERHNAYEAIQCTTDIDYCFNKVSVAVVGEKLINILTQK